MEREVIGLIPAGGEANRIAPLPCSKELLPVGFHPLESGSPRPKPVCLYLLESMRLAGITKAYVVLRKGKWDIPAYLGDGATVGMNLAYLMLNLPYGVPFTVDQAHPFVRDSLVAVGFPDVIFRPQDAFRSLLERQSATQADVVLGLFPTDQPQSADMVEFDSAGRVRQLEVKPARTKLRFTWMIAVWTPAFTEFMHQYLAAWVNSPAPAPPSSTSPTREELFIGDVIQAAIQEKFRVDSVCFPGGSCLDVGIPENFVRAVRDEAVAPTEHPGSTPKRVS